MRQITLFFITTLIFLAGFSACRPTAYYRNAGVPIQIDSIDYAGFWETQKSIDIPGSKLLAKLRIRDAVGLSRDCSFSDVLKIALADSRRIGGNLLVITRKEQYQVKSRCFKLIGNIYSVPSLEGLEAKIFWNPKRPLLPGDLRGKRPAQPAMLPPAACSFVCRTKGNYLSSVILRSETYFLSDSTYAPADSSGRAFALRRAQLQFDLAEAHLRRVKAALVAFGRDLPSITGQCRPLTNKQLEEYNQQLAVLDGELSASGDPAGVFARWEAQVQGELAATGHLANDVIIDLKKK